jgi:hypothetical protein
MQGHLSIYFGWLAVVDADYHPADSAELDGFENLRRLVVRASERQKLPMRSEVTRNVPHPKYSAKGMAFRSSWTNAADVGPSACDFPPQETGWSDLRCLWQKAWDYALQPLSSRK